MFHDVQKDADKPCATAQAKKYTLCLAPNRVPHNKRRARRLDGHNYWCCNIAS